MIHVILLWTCFPYTGLGRHVSVQELQVLEYPGAVDVSLPRDSFQVEGRVWVWEVDAKEREPRHTQQRVRQPWA